MSCSSMVHGVDSADRRRRPRHGASEARFCVVELPAGTTGQATLPIWDCRGEKRRESADHTMTQRHPQLSVIFALTLSLRPRLRPTTAVVESNPAAETVKFPRVRRRWFLARVSPTTHHRGRSRCRRHRRYRRVPSFASPSSSTQGRI